MKNLYTAFLCLMGMLLALTQSQAKSFSSITGNTIGSDQTICTGSIPASLTGSLPGGGTGVYTYQWIFSTTSATTGFANIAGATAQGYSSPALAANRWFRRIVISGIERDTTAAVAITITPIIIAASNTVTAAQTICYNTIPALLNGSSPTGGNGTYNYQWQSSPDNAAWSDIGGATAIGFQPPALTANTWYRRTVISGGCTHISGSIKITVTPVINPGTNNITTNQSVCTGQTPLALAGSTPTGGSGTFTYLWESSTTSAVSGFATAAGVSNGINYSPGALTQTTFFHRVVLSGGCSDISTPIQILVVGSPPGNPAVFGNGVWNVYGYSDNAFGTYAGYYTEPLLSFNTTTKYTNNQSPSYAPGYQGCLIPNANFSASMKQTNFTPGNYQINLNSLDDNLSIILNGTQIYTHACCTAVPINNIWTGSLGAADQMELRWTGLGTPNYLSLQFVPVTPAPLVPGSISQNLQVCFGEVPPSGFTSTAAPTSGCTLTGVQWQKSIDSITWLPIAGATANTYTESAALTQTTWYRRVATDACNNSAPTTPVKVTVNVIAPGDPTVYGNNIWNVYVFQGTGAPGPYAAATYKGYYTEPLLSFNSTNRWLSTASPSNASGYQGCLLNINNTWVDYKRTNFTPAIYQIDIPYHDDDAYLFVNGVQVFVHNGCCDSHTNVWTGPLGPTDQVEFRVSQGGGPSSESLTLTPVIPPALTSGATTPSQTICAGNVPPTPFTQSVAPTGGCTIKNYSWDYSTDNGVTWTTISGATAISYTATTSIYSQTLFRRTVYDVCGNSAVAVPDTVYMNNSAPGDPTVFGNNTWNVYCFQDINYSIYAGYYTEPLLTFSTPNRYPATSPPSTASGYLGCQLINTYYSVSMKRTGFTAGLYQIDVTSDDDYNLIYINGALVSSLTYPTIQNNVWTGNLGPTDQIEVRWRNNAGPGQTGVRFTLVTPPPLVPGSIVAYNPNLCFNDLPIINEVTPASGGCFVNYSWQSSIDGGTTWTTVVGATGNSYTASVSPTTNIQFRRVASDVCGSVVYTAPVSFIQTAGTVGNPAVYGNGVWNVYAYDAQGASFATAQYLGYYVEPLLTFNSLNRWGANGAPSDASGYQGCQVDQDNHWVSYRQTNFTPGTYQIDVTYHDDDGYLFVNGVQVWSHVGCCDTHPNVWTGVLGATDNVEFRWRENFGASSGALTFTNVTPSTAVNPGTIAAGQIICANTIPVAFTSTLDATSSCFISYQWQSSPDNATWSDIAGATLKTYASGAVAAKTYFRRKATNSCGISQVSNTIIVDVYPAVTAGSVSADQTFCKGTTATSLASVTLPTGGDGIYVYQWQSSLDNIGWSNIAGATATTYAPGVVPITTYYRRKVTACGAASSAVSNFVTITVNQLPAITTQPNVPTGCTGSGTSITVAATGAGVLTYQWQVNTGSGFVNVTNVAPYSGANTATLTINPLVAGMAGYIYHVIVGGLCTPAITSNNVTLTVATNPVITTQPANTTACAGSNPVFSINASGSGLTYQWQIKVGAAWNNLVDDAVYSGTLTSALTITNVIAAMSGNIYRCVLNTTCAGILNSNQATLTVVAALNNVISADQTICTGTTAAALTGTTGGTFLWQTSTVSSSSGFVTAAGVNNGSGYAPNPVSTTTWYQRIQNNGTCSNTSNVVTITLNSTPITITTQPTAQSVCAGGVAVFTGAAAGPGTLSYQWYENNGTTNLPITDGGIYSGSATNTLTLTGVTAGMNGYKYSFRAMASGCSASSVPSNQVALNTNNATKITGTAADFTTCQGSSVQINDTATGINLIYQWQFNSGSGWNNLSNFGSYSNVNGNSLRINPTLASMNGIQYRCIVNGDCAPLSVTSATTTMLVNGPVTNNSISNSQSLCAGTPAPFTGSTPTGGNGTYAYQWYLNTGSGNSLIPGATGINYASGSLAITTQFLRQVTSGACASVNSTPITVTIQPPTSTTDPVNTTVCAGTNASFSVTGTGSGLSYQWQVNTGSSWTNVINGASYTGVTTTTLNVLAPPFASNGYQYRCIVSGNCSPPSVNSNPATLTVNPAAVITGQPSNVNSCQGSTVNFQVTATGPALTYQWMEKIGAGAFTNITDGGIYSGSSTATLTLTGITTAMNTNQYLCVITAGTCPLNSSPASLTVNSQPLLVITNPAPACAPATVNITAAAITAGSNLAGGTLTYWNDIGFTSPVSNPTAIAVSGTYYIRVATSPVCFDIKPVVVTVNSTITNNIISTSQAICTGTSPAGLTGGVLGGGTGVFTYQWQVSTDNISYSDIGGAVNPNYNPGALAATTWYRRIVNSGVCTNTSAAVQITVVSYPTATINYPATSYCETGTANVTQTGQAGGTYSALPAGLSINAATGAINLGTSTPNSYVVTYAFSNGTCNGSTTANITIVTLPNIVITNPAAACTPSTVDITAAVVTVGSTAGLTYTYFTDAAGTLALATPNAVAASGTYFIKGTAVSGCSDIKPVVVTINPKPTVTITNPAAVCAPGTIDLTVASVTAGSTAGLTYTYFTDAAGTLVLATPNAVATGGTYYIKGTTAAGCSDIKPVVVTINPKPTVTITNPAAVCSPSTVDITAAAITAGSTAGLTYTYFTDAAGTLVLGTPNALTASGTYYIKGTTAAGCSDIKPVVVTINSKPTVTITNPAAVCSPGTIDLTVAAVTTGSTAGLTYTYFTDAAGTLVLATPNAVALGGTYYIKGSTASGCSDIKPVVVTINPKPTVAITNPAAICSPGTVDITAIAVTTGSTAGLTYTYFTDAAGTLVLGTPNAVAANGTYYIKGTTASGCSDIKPVVVTINPKPTVTITNPAAVCAPATVDITAAAVTAGSTVGLTYTYFTDAAGTLVLATPNAVASSGTYYIKGSTAAGCSDTKPVVVTINPKPTVTITNPAAICTPGTIDITAAAITAGSTAGLTYTYFTDAAGTLVLGSPNAVAASGTYYIKGTTASGCSDIKPVVVTINPKPTVAITNPAATCAPGTVDITVAAVTAGSTAGLTFTYFTDAAGTLVLATPNAVTTSGTYYIKGSTAAGCSDIKPVVVTINPKPTVNITNPAAVCAPGTVDITAAAVTAGSTAGLTFTYFTDAAGTLALATPNAVSTSGTYYIKGTTVAGCSDIKPVVVTVNPKPVVVITNPAAVCSPTTVNLTLAAVTAGSTAGLTFTYFTDAAGTLVLGSPNAVATSGTYYIRGTTAAGCSDIKPVVVTINPKPTVTITNPAAVCAPGTVDITVAAVTAGSTAGLTYSYFTDAAGTLVLATPNAVATSGTYYIKGSTVAGCTDIKPVIVTVNPKPTVTITNPAAVCAPGTVDITAAAVTTGSTAGLVFTYFTDAAGTLVLVTPNAVTTSGTYYIKGSTAAGCSDIKPVVVTINPKPTVTVTNPAAVCAPGTVDITAGSVTAGSTAGLTYSYFTDAAGTLVLATPNAVAVSGTYYIKGSTAAGCSDIKPVVVTINPKPTVTITNPAAVCAPGTIDLTAAAVTAGSTAGLTYTYFTDAAGTLVLVSPNAVAASGTYYIKGTTASGCSDIKPVVVTINPKPTVTITNPAAACSPGTVDITVAAVTAGSTAGLTYTYFTDAAGTLVLATPNAVAISGTYYIKGSAATGCSDIKPVVVTINAKPTVTITNPAAICAPGTIDLTAATVTAGSTAGLTYTYFTDAAGTLVLATPNALAASGTYYIKGTTASGCSDIKPVVVSINPKPTVTITNPATVCAPGTVDITVAAVTAGSTAGLTYTYFTDAAGTLVLATPNAVATSGTYYIKGSTVAGCSDIKPVVVTINLKPSVVITNPAATCAPGTVDITVAAVTAGSTAGLTYTYFTDAAGTLVLATPNAVASSGTYYIKGTTASGCSDIKPVVVTINAKPAVTITNPAAVCAPGTVDITVPAVTAGSTAGLTYTYFTDAAGTLVLAAPNAIAIGGTYYIKGTTATGCSDIQPVVVTVNPKPTVTITNPAAICSPGTVDITVAAVTTGSTAGLTYTYFTDAAGTIILGTPNAVSAGGIYYIKGTTASGCSDIKPVIVTINPKPTVTITNPAPVCSPATVDLTVAAVTVGSTAGLTYTYFTDAAGTLVLATPNAVAVGGTYYIKGSTGSGCSDIQPVIVTVNLKPTVTITNPAAVCSPGTIDITAAAVTAGSTAGLTYTYFTDAAGTLVLGTPNAVAASGTYYIRGTTASGCSDIKPVVVIINSKPTIVITNPAAVCAPGTVDITAVAVTAGSTAGLTFTYFTDAAGTLGLGTPNAVAASGTYYIKGTTAAGCSDIKPVVVTINPKPSVTITNPAAVCAPGTIDLTAAAVTAGSTAGLTYTYYTDAAGTLVLGTPNAVATSGTYYIKGKTALGCSDIKPVVVTINPLPIASISYAGTPYCATGTANITQTGQAGGTYSSTPAGLSLNPATGAVNLSTSTPGLYNVTYTFTNGTCSDSKTTSINIITAPVVTITNPAAACSPGTVDLTAAPVTAGSTGGLTYSYFTDAAGTLVLGTPNAVATSGTYYIKGSAGSGCSDIKPVVVVINAKPTVVTNDPASVCPPLTIDLTVAAVTAGSTVGLTYTYFTDAAGTTVLANANAVTAAGTYYIKGTAASGCSDIKPVIVTFNALPTATIAYTGGPYCATGTATVTQTGLAGGVYSAPGAVSINSANGDINLGASTPGGPFTITYTFSNGTCSNSTTTTIVINALPIASISYSGSPYCATGTANVTQTGQGGGSYSSAPAGLSINVATGTINLGASTPSATPYTVTYSFGNGTCSNTTQANVTILPLPAVTITNPAAICVPGTIDLTAAAVTAGSTAGLTFTYFTDAAGTLVLGSPNAVAASGTYYVKGTTASGCSDIKPVVVTINPKPTVTITNPAAVCSPGTVDITAAAVTAGSTAGLTYSYFTDVAGTLVLATPNAVATSGTYYIKGTTASGCSDIKPVVVTINPKPTVTITNPAAVCAPGTVDITAAAVTAGSTAGLTYTYFTDAAGTLVLATPNAIAVGGTYYIKGSTAAGCSDIRPVVVTINPKPTIVITDPAPVCTPGTVDLTVAAVTAGSTAGLAYTYFTDAAGTIVLATPNSVASSGTYYIKGTAASGCSDIKPVVVSIILKPSVVITNPSATCAPGTVDITASAVTAGSTVGLTYSYFTDAAGTFTLATPNAVATSGTYYIKGTTASGCSDIQPVVVAINPKPTVVITNPAAICAPGTIDITTAAVTAGSTAGLTYTYFTDAAGTLVLATPNAVSISGTYYIKGTTAAGCSDIKPVVLTINALPIASIAYSGSPYCATGTATVTLTGQAGGTFTAPVGVIIDPVTGNINLASSAAGTFTVIYTFSNGTCSNTTPAPITINALPTATINYAGSPYCATGTAVVTQNGQTGGTYSSAPAGLSINPATGDINLGTSLPSATPYTVTYSFGNGTCNNTTQANITVLTLPTVNITNPPFVCSPSTVDLTAAAVTAGSTAGLTYTYFTDAAGTLALATPNAVATGGTYYIKGTTASGCSDIKPVVVTINPKPTVAITNPPAVCSPTTVDLTAAAITAGSTLGLTYTYFTDAAGTLVLGTPNAILAGGTYYIKGSTAAGCSDIKPVVVTINPKPTVTITNPAAVCSPATVDITAATVTAGSTAGLTYTYFTDAAGTLVLATPNAVVISGTYYIKGSAATGCSDIKPVVVTINAKPTVAITNPAAICAPGTIDLTSAAITSGSTPGLTYTYFTDAAGTLVLATPNAVTTSGTYYIRGTTAAGCSDIQPVVVTVNLKPTIAITNPAATCAPATVDITVAAVTAGSTAGLTYTYFTDAAATLILATPNTIAVSGTYYIKGTTAAGCSDIKPVAVSINPLPAATINYAGSPYCATGIATVTQTGLAGGTYSAPAGVSINAITGAINLATSAAGTYTVTYTFSNGTCSNSTPATITINALPTATITYAGSPYCAAGTATVTQSGQGGGTYSALPAGLSINTATGAIDLSASTANTYVVTYSFTNGTCNNTTTGNITIISLPVVVITNPVAVCAPGIIDLTAATVTAGSTAGLTYTYFTDATGTLVLASPNAVAASGTYYIKGTTASGCSDIKPVVVTINPKPTVTITNPAAVCAPGTVDITAATVTAGSTAGLTYTYFTDAAATLVLATPNAIVISGTYYIKGTTASGCSDIQPVIVTVNALPVATITYSGNPYCATGFAAVTQTGQTGGTYSAIPAGLVIDATTGSIDLTASTPGITYTVKYSFTNGTCSNTTTSTVFINALPTASISYTSSPYCATGTATVTQSGLSGGTYTAPLGVSINAITGDIDLATSTAGTYAITYTFSNGTCANSTTANITINALPTATIAYAGSPYCASGIATVTQAGQTGGTYSSTAGLVINASTGDIDLAASTAGATYTVTYAFGNGTCNNSTTTSVRINALPTAAIAYAGSPYCASGTATVTQAGQAGGTYSSTAGLVINAVTGDIDLAASTPGSYTVTYTFSNGICGNSTTAIVNITNLPVIVITDPSPVCAPATIDITAASVTAGSASGLTYSYYQDAAGTIVLSLPNTIALGGTYYIRGTGASGCSDIKPVVVTINPKPTVVINTPGAVCAPNTIDLTLISVTTGSTAGLTYTYFQDAAATIGLVNPNAVATAGTYYIKGATAAGCTDIKPVTLTINALPLASVSYAGSPYCATGTATATLVGQTGGFFSAPAAVSINGVTGDVDLAASIPGNYTVTYTFSNGICSNSTTAPISINPIPVVATTNPAAVCAPLTVNLTLPAVTAGSTPGLTYTYYKDAAGTIVLTNPATVSVSGTYFIKGTTGSGCSMIKPVVVTINPLPLATIMYTGSPYCKNGVAVVSLIGIPGGTFTSAAGLSLNPVTGDINLAASNEGTYTVFYSFTNGTCSNTAFTSVTVKNPPLVINNPAATCSPATVDLTNPSVTAGSQAGMNFNYYQDIAGTIALAGPATVGTPGTYYIKGVDPSTGCSTNIQPVVVTVFAKPAITASSSATDICKGTMITLTASSPGNTVEWLGFGTGNVFTDTPLADTTYQAVATAASGCTDTAFVSVTVKPFKLTLTANPDPVLAGTNTTLTTSGTFTYNVLSWSPDIFFADQTATVQNIVVKDTSKSFTVIAQSTDGCLDTATLYVTVDPNLKDFFIPNSFSPNNDGTNDIFRVYGSSIRDVTMRVYNQWGELIFETQNAQNGWDGTWKGRPQAVGVYVYIAQVTFYNNVKIMRKGTINLIR